ncbi:unnamed protein product [Paramecium primaurelia]|uniref:Uncharacterized protein n=1 Tax=Paramecium primaurelia TaxID=5886 RepID=A0A8S1JMJ8_PARPR|nr:unnamed protein product [Paramecium primaurelia]
MESPISKIFISDGGSLKNYDQIQNYGEIIRINEFDALKFGFKLLDDIKQKTYITFNNGIEYLQLRVFFQQKYIFGLQYIHLYCLIQEVELVYQNLTMKIDLQESQAHLQVVECFQD